MARLTLTFRGKTLQVLPIETGETSIGRDADNAMQIDSLAVAPRHAVIYVEARGMVLRQMDKEYPVVVNGQKVEEHVLKSGDCFGVGKHEVFFVEDDATHGLIRSSKEAKDAVDGPALQQSDAPQRLPDAGLQVMNGKHIGLVIPLRTPMTRLDKDHAHPAVVARRNDGYYLSSLATSDDNGISVNGEPIGNLSVRLKDGDVVKIASYKLQFFFQK